MANEIRFFHRPHKKIEVEKVYGDAFIRFLYCSAPGQALIPLLNNKFLSNFYGELQNKPASRKKVPSFIKQFSLQMDDYLPGSIEDKPIEESYAHFNEFFIRKLKPEARPFVTEPERMAAFAEARYVGFEAMNDKEVYPVKGKYLRAKDLLAHEQLSKVFEGGPLLIARLCPVDYHRYHYPDHGKVLDHFPIHGKYDSVNPLALKAKGEIMIQNERHVSILQTENFGKLAYIEVGAMCVGKIVQTHDVKNSFLRGEEKGYFLFGGSTVIVLGEKGAWKPSLDILENTKRKMETYLKLGTEVAVKA